MLRAIQNDQEASDSQGNAGPPQVSLTPTQGGGGTEPTHLLLVVTLDSRSERVGEAVAHLAPQSGIDTDRSAINALLAEALRLGSPSYVLRGVYADALMAGMDDLLRDRREFVGDGTAPGVARVSAHGGDGPIDALSARERQIVQLVVRGKSSAQIGTLLHLSPKTVDSYRSRMMAKLGVADVPALVRLAIRCGLISAEEI